MIKTILLFLAIIYLQCWHEASAQNVQQTMDLLARSTAIQAALGEWKKIPDDELGCIDKALNQQGKTLQSILQKGISPSSPSLVEVRDHCKIELATNSSEENVCRVVDPTGTPLNVRRNPDGPISMTLHNGTKITVLNTAMNNGKPWVSVALNGVPVGWIFRDYIYCQSPTTPNPSSAQTNRSESAKPTAVFNIANGSAQNAAFTDETSPELVFGNFLKKFVGFQYTVSPDTQGACQKSANRWTCLRGLGYDFVVEVLEPCVLKITNTYPIRNMVKSWDGKISGTYINGTSIIFPLTGMSSERISSAGGAFKIVIAFNDRRYPLYSIRTTASGDKFIELPPTPLLKDVGNGFFSSKEDRVIKLAELIWKWQADVSNLGTGDLNVPYFRISTTDDDAFLVISTPEVRSALFLPIINATPQEYSAAERNNAQASNNFIAAIKSVLAKCSK